MSDTPTPVSAEIPREKHATKILSARFGVPGSHTLEVYRSHGGYEVARRALTAMQPAAITDEVKRAGLRGRGGAGFPAGVKWGFLGKDTPRYLCVNADESEPGTFKDRFIMEKDPHLLLEGILITCFAIGSNTAYVYIRGEYTFPKRRMDEAIAEAYAAGFLGKDIFGTGFDCDVVMHRGAGAYICGEETALLESLEGKRGFPRLKPPFPATHGAFGKPTVVNNVATIATVPWIIQNGADAHAKLGTATSAGTFLWSISGCVNKPGYYETELGIPLRELIESPLYGGGVRGGKALKAVIPGGSSVPILTAAEAMAAPMDYDVLAQQYKTFLGSGAVIVLDEDTCVVRSLANLMRFYAHESCGQCSPCREGTGWLYKIVKKMELGQADEKDLALVLEIADNMEGKTICALSAAAAMPARSYISKFRDEFIEHVTRRACPKGPLPPSLAALYSGHGGH